MPTTIDQDFLGTGWSFPPAFDKRNATVVMTGGVVNIRQSLWVLLSTTIGERIMLAPYGSNLQAWVFSSLTETMANQISAMVAKAILDWEPRINVSSIDVVELDPANGQLGISIDFTVITTNTRANLVYPFYLNEATLPPLPP
ncbi:MAG TPA: GPW/gp25 family protein [Rhodopila sp.]|jgi:phage baseplate assembly protein W|nr:GPW/gp25 family protein [Rhodopila sp.]